MSRLLTVTGLLVLSKFTMFAQLTGRVTGTIFEDNTKAWSGDHCVDPRLVPGVLFSNKRIAVEKPAIVDLAPTILKLFGLSLPSHLDGKPWTIATATREIS